MPLSVSVVGGIKRTRFDDVIVGRLPIPVSFVNSCKFCVIRMFVSTIASCYVIINIYCASMLSYSLLFFPVQ